MLPFRCTPIPTETAERFRRMAIDDHGNELRRVEVSTPGGFPCRHCLRHGDIGQPMLLGSYALPRPRGLYWTPSPIFVHAEPCPRYDRDNEIAPVVRGSLVSIRAYDDSDMCLYDLGQVCAGDDADRPLANAIADNRTAFVNIHTARPGCLLTRVDRMC